MKEEYIHYVWESKRLPVQKLVLVDGNPLEILEFGQLNHDTGPDFFNAKLRLEELIWSGNVEMHVNSSDWYKHGHQHDPTYNNVILHVVYNYDEAVFVNGRELPTLELRAYLDLDHFKNFQYVFKKDEVLPCQPQLKQNKLLVFQQVSVAFSHRFDRKFKELNQVFENANQDYKQVLHYLLFQSFGGRVNKLPFQQLSQILSYQLLLREAWDIQRVEALMLGSSGLLSSAANHPYTDRLKEHWYFLKQKYGLIEMHPSAWRFSGVRPSSFPNLKIVQLAHFIVQWKYEFLPFQSNNLNQLREKFKSNISPFWRNHYSFKSRTLKKHEAHLSEKAQNVIFINAFALFFWFRGKQKGKDRDLQMAMDILLQLPPEENAIVEKWKKRGVDIESAFDTQALLEQNQFFCSIRKCLHCKIGNFMLSNKS
ncbi:Protein of unknown function [Lishizhenia tianjinensis]|uniref:DUF2851 domain-containing protein n=1 Tax=Lishizhenia tianjinensis TaxID=477690 RepID=A0A1I7BLX0_9FLAO|nr:DUF2851 family protein [Lishizhenia tianjinensis]SFT88178.1 Protein of unknown function [Lishizhenia tianjinensis]